MSCSNIKIIKAFPNPNTSRFTEQSWYEEHGQSMVLINCESNLIEYPAHWTPLSLKFVISGKEYYHFKNKSYAVTNENFLILNEGAIYESSINTPDATESLTLNFTKTNIEEVHSGMVLTHAKILDNPFEKLLTATPFIAKLYSNYGDLTNLVYQIRSLIKSNQKEILTSEHFYLVLEKLLSIQNKTFKEINAIPVKKWSTKLELYKRLHNVRDVIDSCYHNELTLEYLGNISFLNSFYLIREFKNVFGISPHQYLIQRRLREAKILLQHDSMSITEIINMVGFKDVSSFSKAFKIYASLSPENYRKNWQRRPKHKY